MEKREKLRGEFHFKTVLSYGNVKVEGEVENLSVKGMFVKTGQKINTGITLSIVLDLSGKSSKLILNLTGEVARQDSDGVAVEFTEIDTDSFIHLRNVVTHSFLNEEKIAKEFDDAVFDSDVRD
jgi:DNA-directed RNA polymerase subunit E'/Rpb7